MSAARKPIEEKARSDPGFFFALSSNSVCGLLQNLREYDHHVDFLLQDSAGDIRNKESEIVLNLRGDMFISRVDVQQRTVSFGKSGSGKHAIELAGAENSRHACLNGVVLYQSQFHVQQI